MLLYNLFVILGLKIAITFANETENKEPAIYSRKDNVHKVFNTYIMPLTKMNNHSMYYDEGENMLLVPNFKDSVTTHANKKKSPKKPPKRITQKIIKKPKSKVKKVYFTNQITSVATMPYEIEDKPIQENNMSKNDQTTTQPPLKKKKKSKLVRYMPFQKLQPRKPTTKNNRIKREINRSDVYILQDLDEMEFLGHNNDEGNENSVIEAHVKKYW